MKRIRTNYTGQQRGFAAIAAIFLVVILAALGGFMVTFSNTQQLTSAQDIQGSRAYWAARAGLEWGIGSATTICPASPTKMTVDNFTVCVTCGAQTYTEASTTINLLQFTSTARSPAVTACSDAGSVGSVGYIERSVSASLER
jgi:MSHA biogenesis protein MshP